MALAFCIDKGDSGFVASLVSTCTNLFEIYWFYRATYAAVSATLEQQEQQ
jgi:hypothetical protein